MIRVMKLGNALSTRVLTEIEVQVWVCVPMCSGSHEQIYGLSRILHAQGKARILYHHSGRDNHVILCYLWPLSPHNITPQEQKMWFKSARYVTSWQLQPHVQPSPAVPWNPRLLRKWTANGRASRRMEVSSVRCFLGAPRRDTFRRNVSLLKTLRGKDRGTTVWLKTPALYGAESAETSAIPIQHTHS